MLTAKPNLPLLILLVFTTFGLSAQYETTADTLNCQNGTPTFIVDLSSNPDSLWVSPPRSRKGDCCGTDNNCVQFSLTLSPNATGINFFVPDGCGAQPSGSLFYQVDCGPLTSVGTPLCLDGQGPFTITFCKPGNNQNCYSIQSIPEPSTAGDVVTADGCTDTLRAFGLSPSSISWNSISPGAPGAYNGLLSNLGNTMNGINGTPFMGFETVVVTPGMGSPASISYVVCGQVEGFCISEPFCDTVTVSIYPTLFAHITPDPVAICYGSIGETLTANPIGGTAPYNYLWSTGETTQSINITAPGEYSVLIGDITGCPYGLDTVVATQYFNPITANAGSNVNICGSPTPTVNLNGSVSGVTTGLWSGGAGTFNPSVNSLNVTYTPSVGEISAGQAVLYLESTNNDNCPGDMDTVVINLTTFIAALTSTAQSASCTGSSNGSIDLSVIGSPAPFTYLWSTGATTQDVSGLSAGSYSVTVTDAYGCAGSLPIMVNEPSPLTILDTIYSNYNGYNISCYNGYDGTLQVIPGGGTAPYSYTWSSGATTPGASGLSAGSYTVTVTDANGCAITQTYNLNQPTPLNTNLTPAIQADGYNVSGCTNDGSIDLAVNGGTPGYSYSWSNGSGSQDVNNLLAGTYTVVVTDANGCQISDQVTLTAPNSMITSIVASNYPSGHNISCNGLSDGSINLTVSGGSAPYSYSWNTGAISQDISNVPAGSYDVTITDQNGCQTVASISLTQPPILTQNIFATIYPSGDNISCFSFNDGSVNYSVNGGAPGYSFNWSTGASSEDISGLTAGNYSVQVTDINGCQIDTSITLTQPIILSGNLTPSSFAGGYNLSGCANDGSINLNVIGGSPSYTYSWNTGAFTQDINDLALGTYSVTVTDINGCTITDEITLTAPPALTTSISAGTYPSGHNVSCFGLSDGSINLTVGGGVAPYTYSWSNGATQQDISGLPTGNYDVVITDANGCQITNSITLVEPQPLIQNISAMTYPSGSNISCFNLSDGSIDYTVTGGAPGYTYTWSNGQSTEDVSNLAPGTYSVTVTDLNGCQNTTSITLVQPPLLTDNMTPLVYEGGFHTSGCANDGSINLSVAGGSPVYSYTWSNGAVTQDLSNLPAGTYSVLITDINGCQITDEITLTAPNSLNTTIVSPTYASGHNISCFGLSDGSIDLEVTGGAGPYTYSWWIDGVEYTSQDINGVPAGNYSVTITDANACPTVTSIVLNEPTPFTQTVSSPTYPSGDNISCFGLNDGSVDYSIEGGAPGYSFSWSNGQMTEDLSGLVAGSYVLTVTDLNGCQTDTTIVLTQPVVLTENLTASVYAGGFNVSGCTNDGSIDLQMNGGSPIYTFAWSNGATSEDVSLLSAGTYTVTITDINGCQITDQITLTAPNSMLTTITAPTYPNGDNISCYGLSDGSIDLTVSGGSAPYSYAWNNGSSTQDLNNQPAGTYNVTITDANGCQTVTSIVLTQPALLVQTISSPTYPSGDNISCFGLFDGSVDYSIVGGAPGYSFTWSNGSATEDLSGLAAGTYSVIVTDLNGCQTDTTITLVEPVLLDNNLTASIYSGGYNVSGCTNDGSIDLTITGGSPIYDVSWSNGSITEDLNNLSAGTYTATITDINGCQITDQITLSAPISIEATTQISSYPSTHNISCNGSSDGWIDLGVTGGTTPYSYLWSTGATSQDLNLIPAGSYSVTVTDANGCQVVVPVVLNEPDPFSQDINATVYPSGDNISCFNFNDGSINYTLSGGSPGYVFNWSNGITLEDISNLTAGTYSVTAVDINGCSIDTMITLTEPTILLDELTASVYSGGYNVSGCTNDGSIDLNISGGSPVYNVAWSTGSVTEDINNLSAGSYDVTITDINGCQITDQITLIAPVSLLTDVSVISDYNGQDISCYGVSDGAVSISVQGGTPGFTYTWTNAQGIQLGSTQNLQNLPEGTYYVHIIDANGCSALDSITLTDPDPFDAETAILSNFNGVDISCYGAADGTAQVNMGGGTPAYTFTWVNAFGQIVGSASTVNNLSAGEYTISIQDINGCSMDTTIRLAQPSPIETETFVESNYNGQQISCFQATDGIVSVSASGGTPDYQYQWLTQTGGLLSSVSIQQGLGEGTYFVSVTDGNGCQAINSVSVSDPGPVVPTIEILTNYFGHAVSCNGATDGSVVASTEGGTPGYSYSWGSHGASSDSLLTELGTGTYVVNVTDINNCYGSALVVLDANPLPNINPDVKQVICFGEMALINSNVQGGVSCEWYFSNGMELLNCGPQQVFFEEVGCYDANLVLTNQYGCVDSMYLTEYVCVQPLPIASFTSNSDEMDILNSTTDFVNTSQGAVSYFWEFGDGSVSSLMNPSHTFPSADDGYYDVILHAYTEFGCESVFTERVRVEDELLIYVPNAFTPDFDEFNQVFKPVFGSGFDPNRYQMSIFNRWGELIFETTNTETGWDGTYRNREEQCQDGVYVWKIHVGEEDNLGIHEFVGHVSLLR